MLTILLVALTLSIFWLLFRNSPAYADTIQGRERSWIGPTKNQEEWHDYRSEVFQPFGSQTCFYAIAYFTNFVAAANAISWSTVYLGELQFIASRFGSYFALSSYDALLVSGFVALAFFVINWQLAMYCAGILSQYLVRILIINRARFAAISLVFCSYFAYLLTVGIFWLFHESYTIWYGLSLTPIFIVLALIVAVSLPSMKTDATKKQ